MGLFFFYHKSNWLNPDVKHFPNSPIKVDTLMNQPTGQSVIQG